MAIDRSTFAPDSAHVLKAEHAGVRPADASTPYLSAQQVADLVQVSAKTKNRSPGD